MENGIKVKGGERIGKTIIFAASKDHATFIVERFNKLYPKLATGGFIKRVVCADDYSHTIIDEFKYKELPVITVSVDMMDTGIDVPEVVNLVFFKQVKSRTKFWQMIGRGTRLCEELYASDCIDGEYADKRRFFIFDYCSNFEFFREGTKVPEGKEPASLSEIVFSRQVELVRGMQVSAFAGDDYQQWRSSIVYAVVELVADLDRDKVSVKLKRRSVDKYSSEYAYVCLSDIDVHDLQKDVAPLVRIDEDDEFALRFDALMYGFMVCTIMGDKTGVYCRKLRSIGADLETKATIPQVKEKLPLIKRLNEEGYLEGIYALQLEELRVELRELIKFLAESGKKLPAVITNLKDPIFARREGVVLAPDEDYVEANGYMEASALLKPPFDRPASFIKLFDDARQKRLIELINQVKNNAIKPAA